MKFNERTSTKRSSNLRSQRSEREQERISQAAERARHPSNMPPVMSRQSMAGAPGSRRKSTQTNVRRKVYYSVGNNGTEVRLPTMPVLRPSWRILSGLMVIGLLAGLWAMWSSSMFQIDKISIQGAERIPHDEITNALNLVGESVLKANPADLEKTIYTSFPDVSKASIQVGLPASVAVRVNERQPIIAWQEEKETLWIDADGMAFTPRGNVDGLITVQAKGTPPAPASTSATPEGAVGATTGTGAATPTPAATPIALPDAPRPARAFITADLIAAIQKLSSQAPANTPILYDPHYGLGWNDPQGWVVYFGSNVTNMDLKLQQLKVITGELATKQITPKMISVEFPQAPFYRLEP
jgi:cell division protein FtsQ